MNDKLELMHALADGQLDAEEQKRAQELAANDPECAAELKWAQETRRTVHAKCRMEGDEEVWQASMKRLDAIDRTKTTEKFVSKYAWAFCAVVMVAIFSGAITNRTLGTQSLSNVQVADLLNPGAFGRSAETTVNPETASALNLSGYRIIQYGEKETDGRNCAYFRLRDSFGNLALVGIPDRVVLEGINSETGLQGFRSGAVNGANTVTWTMGENTFVLSANRPTQELLDIAQNMVR